MCVMTEVERLVWAVWGISKEGGCNNTCSMEGEKEIMEEKRLHEIEDGRHCRKEG